MKIDWSKAPEGATHYGPETQYRYAAWYKKVEGLWRCWRYDGGSTWFRTIDLPSRLIPRHVEWNGTGLPTVGTVCEVDCCEEWRRCEVIAHFQQRCGMVAAFTIEGFDGAKSLDAFGAEYFRPIRTPEQIAAEEREKDVAEMQSHFKFNVGQQETLRAICFALYDAGYRKTEQEQEP